MRRVCSRLGGSLLAFPVVHWLVQRTWAPVARAVVAPLAANTAVVLRQHRVTLRRRDGSRITLDAEVCDLRESLRVRKLDLLLTSPIGAPAVAPPPLGRIRRITAAWVAIKILARHQGRASQGRDIEVARAFAVLKRKMRFLAVGSLLSGGSFSNGRNSPFPMFALIALTISSVIMPPLFWYDNCAKILAGFSFLYDFLSCHFTRVKYICLEIPVDS